MKVVRLSWHECRIVAQAGAARRMYALHNGAKDRHSAPSADHGWQIDIDGMFGEYVVAKALGWFWLGADPAHNPSGDVAHLQVRTTPRSNGSLIVHDTDPDDRAFVLVTGQPPTFNIPGWMAGRDAKQAHWWRDPTNSGRPAFFVPQTALSPISDLVPVLS